MLEKFKKEVFQIKIVMTSENILIFNLLKSFFFLFRKYLKKF